MSHLWGQLVSNITEKVFADLGWAQIHDPPITSAMLYSLSKTEATVVVYTRVKLTRYNLFHICFMLRMLD